MYPPPLVGEGDRRQAVEGGAAKAEFAAPLTRSYRTTLSRWRERGGKAQPPLSSPACGGGGPRVAWWRGERRTPIVRAPDFIRQRARTLRRATTQPERQLWYALRRNQAGLHFRRQHPVGPYILDFYCAAANLCIEIDGPSHADRGPQDRTRTEWLEREGIRVMRFSIEELAERPAAVVAAIVSAAPPSTA